MLATGSHSFIPPIQGVYQKGVFTLRTVDDARRIIACCETAEKVLLIGGGLLGLEAGNALRKRGKQVTVVEFFPRLLPRQLDERGAGRLRRLMEDMGLSFRIGVTTKEIAGTGSVENVILQDDAAIPADMVIVSAGVRPNLEPARWLGLKCNSGIIVDSTLRTSRPEVFAAGDTTEFEGMIYGIWPAAMQQGKAAGANMAGGSLSYKGTTMANKLKVVGIDLAAAGEIDVENRHENKITETDSVYRKLVIDDNRLIGCIMLGDTSDFASMTKAITEKKDISQVLS